jgi:hypothetical protein
VGEAVVVPEAVEAVPVVDNRSAPVPEVEAPLQPFPEFPRPVAEEYRPRSLFDARPEAVEAAASQAVVAVAAAGEVSFPSPL